MNITIKDNFTIKAKIKRKGREYIDECLKGKLINNNILKESENPKVTLIIPTYNEWKRIKFVIRTFQNQNMEDIEIILIKDYSKDKKILNNSHNMGTLYSRSIGVLQAKWEYITFLDSDDLFFDKDVFDTTYKPAENGKFDIIAFLHFNSPSHYSKTEDFKSVYNFISHNHLVFQPELSIYPQFNNDGFTFFDY